MQTLRYVEETGAVHKVPVHFTQGLMAAVEGADIIFCAVPAFQHNKLINQILPYLRAGQYVVFFAYFGALKFLKSLERYPSLKGKVNVVESASAFHAARSPYFGAVEILGAKSSVPVAVYPPARVKDFCAWVKPVLPCDMAAQNILHTSLMSVGPVLHVPLVLSNVARIESSVSGDWQFYAEGLTPAVESYIRKLDAERLTICKKFGLTPYSIETLMSQFFYRDRFVPGDFFDWLRNNGIHTAQALKAPTSVDSRYLIEGIEYGLKPLLFLAAQVGGNFMPLTQSSVQIAQAFLDKRETTIDHFLRSYLSLSDLHDILAVDNVVGM
eukprot:TRINITY_DN9960_c0_g1_i1.p1 TRINITY_DN9960_c0_g1~~TRINITY_DN9960_c0_g1_i1.p1  ORF type:complete len:326 (+),score=-64.20 TRINITY_DN9960_c0_g1_i1:337-1314(+)